MLKFVEADTIIEIQSIFESLKEQLPVENLKGLQLFDQIKQIDVPFKLKRFFKLLDEKIELFGEIRKISNEREIFISGAGPNGLRAAVDGALSGMKVTIVEKRNKFSRLNVIKTWRQTVDDLISLGMKIYLPKIKTHGVLHVGTRDMQLVLFKTALLLGVEIFTDCQFKGIIKPENDSLKWKACFISNSQSNDQKRNSSSSNDGESDVIDDEKEIEKVLSFTLENKTEEMEKTSLVDFKEYPESENGAILTDEQLKELNGCNLVEFDCFLVAEGEKSKTIRNLGFVRKVTRFGPAIGLVMNLILPPKTEQSSLPAEFICPSDQFDFQNNPILTLSGKGISCENIEYMRSQTSHFFVCTVLKKSLVEKGALKKDLGTTKSCLIASNVDYDKLKDFARDIALTVGMKSEHINFADINGLNLFDFSCKGRVADTSRKLDEKAIVLPIGDALVNPYWPQGLGVNLGFQSAMDAIGAILIGSKSNELNIDMIAETYALSYMVARYHPKALLTSQKQWTPLFTTRYSRDLFHTIHFAACSRGDKAPFPKWVEEALNLKPF